MWTNFFLNRYLCYIDEVNFFVRFWLVMIFIMTLEHDSTFLYVLGTLYYKLVAWWYRWWAFLHSCICLQNNAHNSHSCMQMFQAATKFHFFVKRLIYYLYTYRYLIIKWVEFISLVDFTIKFTVCRQTLDIK